MSTQNKIFLSLSDWICKMPRTFPILSGELHSYNIKPDSAVMSKLVRDKVPDIIRMGGREPEVERISGDWLRLALRDKLVEEACELRASDSLYEELADVLEVVDAIVDEYGLDRSKLEDARKEKLARAGGFKEGYLLR
jgi:predicted house-cleaning noncanonical NTP pyrophosphatase (MazG superfamily)